MLFPMRFNTPFRMFRLLTVQGGFVHVDMRFNFENCYNFYRAGVQLALAICESNNFIVARDMKCPICRIKQRRIRF